MILGFYEKYYYCNRVLKCIKGVKKTEIESENYHNTDSSSSDLTENYFHFFLAFSNLS